MKKLLILLAVAFLSSCGAPASSSSPSSSSEPEPSSQTSEEPSVSSKESSSEESSEESSSEGISMDPINAELHACCQYLIDTTNFIEGSAGYGLTQDRYTNKGLSSIAATGFTLGCYPIFVEEGFMEKEDARARASKTLDTVLRMQADETTSYEGCISHFVNKSNGIRNGTSEISTIDTAILISGAIVAGEYFKGEVAEKALEAWGNVNFKAYQKQVNGKTYITMGIDDPAKKNLLTPWDYYAEQWMIYIIGAGNPNESHRLTSLMYKNVTRAKGTYAGIEHIQSWFGSAFTYQFSQAFFNFKEFNDYKGNNFFENSVKAAKTQYAFSKDLAKDYPSFDSPAWGLSACDAPTGYNGNLGAAPRGWDGYNDNLYKMEQGTVAPYSAVASMPFLPQEAYDALVYYQSLERLNDPLYGLRDSYNLDFRDVAWYDPDFIAIDKGITALQLYNYKNPDYICSLSMNNNYVIRGFINNEFSYV